MTTLIDYIFKGSVLSLGDHPMDSMGISEFKAHALKILDLIAKSHQSLIITKRGKPLVKILPCSSDTNEVTPKPGKLAHTLVFEKDITAPLNEAMWEACQ
jgi:prevent-host-death family protein